MSRLTAREHFEPGAIDRHDIASVRDRMTLLDRFPGRLLPLAVFRLFRRQPSDRRWIDQDLGALHRGQARGLGIPLIPADQHANLADLGVPDAETEIAGREVEF